MLNFIDFIRQKWSEVSESTGQKGTMVDELAVKPTGLIMGQFYNSLASERRINDVTNWNNMSESELDFFGNKFFTPRIYGDYAFGNARIWFDQKINIEISANARFTTGTGLQYRAVQPGFINSGSFIRSTDRFALYYIDVPVVAVTRGDSYNVEAGSITQILNINFVYKMVSNPLAIVNGSMYENNEQYFKRLTYAINDRSMMNKRSIYTRLPEFFPIIRSQYIASAGDKYMNRDLVEAVDVSAPPKETSFLGKVQGENIVKSVGFYQIFPYEAGNSNAGLWGPLSPISKYNYPLTIDPYDIQSTEPAFHGYATNQECTDTMYKGLFFDDYKTYMEVATQDLFNISNENVGYTPVQIPSPDWVYGANGYSSSNIGNLADGVNTIDVLSFSNNLIKICGGAVNTISAGKDIQKRIGVKVSGSFIWPTVADETSLALNSNLQIMVGGVNGSTVDAYTGIGFGVHVSKPYTAFEDDPEMPTNASIYFAHSEKYGSAQVYLTDEDLEAVTGGHMIGDINALAETPWRIEPGIEYEFEFIIYDDLRLTLFLNKADHQKESDPSEQENTKHFSLSGTALNVFSTELKNPSTTRYGTMMKFCVDTKSQDKNDQWQIINLRAFDIAEKKATAMFALDVDHLETPINLLCRANGTSAVDNLFTSGYQVYIWDKEGVSEASGDTELSSGAWKLVPSMSNPDGSKNSLEALFSFEMNNIDRYRVQNRFGNNVFLLFTTTGTTKLKSRYANEIENDIHSILHIDYVKAESGLVQSYHANNKADIYLTTLSNMENLVSNTVVLNKQANESYFEMNSSNSLMPVADILSVTVGSSANDTRILSNSAYTVVRTQPLLNGSSKEIVIIYLNGVDSDSITVEYTTYPAISSVQEFFDGPTYGKVFGDILVKHKIPITLSFIVYYTGVSNDIRVTDAIKTYFDENITGVFVVKDMISYLYNQGIVNNIREPIEITYTRYDIDGNLISGTFNDKIEAESIEFFRITALSAITL